MYMARSTQPMMAAMPKFSRAMLNQRRIGV
jgi:hypothetical protein